MGMSGDFVSSTQDLRFCRELINEVFSTVSVSFFTLDFGSELPFPALQIIFGAIRFPK